MSQLLYVQGKTKQNKNTMIYSIGLQYGSFLRKDSENNSNTILFLQTDFRNLFIAISDKTLHTFFFFFVQTLNIPRTGPWYPLKKSIGKRKYLLNTYSMPTQMLWEIKENILHGINPQIIKKMVYENCRDQTKTLQYPTITNLCIQNYIPGRVKRLCYECDMV